MPQSALIGVQAHDAAHIWPQIEAWVQIACDDEGGSMTAEDFLEAIKAREMQLWIARGDDGIDAIGITEIRVTQRRKTCWVLIMTGKNMARWADFRHVIADWARSQGCVGKKAMKSLARRGYSRLFKEYQCTHVLLERDL